MTYAPLLNDKGLQPKYFSTLGRRWNAATASVNTPGMPHCLQVDAELGAVKMELHNTPLDVSADGRRRAEMSLVEGYEPDQMAHVGTVFYNSFLFRMTQAKLAGTTGMSITQLKPNSGGSPTRCWRIMPDGRLRFTVTRDGATNVKVWTTPLGKRYDQGDVHRGVEMLLIHPTGGAWAVWVDGQLLFNRMGIGIGTAKTNDYSHSLGLYGGEITGDMAIEYADIRLMAAEPLDHLANDRTWPLISCPTCGQPMPRAA